MGPQDAADACAGPQHMVPKAVLSPDSMEPLAEHWEPFHGSAAINLAPMVPGPLGGAFSFMCTLRADSVGSWARVFDFSLNVDDDSVTAGAIGATRDLHFTVFKGRRPVSLRVEGFFELGLELTMLCTVSATGHMKVFKNGELVGERKEGAAPPPLARPHMIVGSHFLFGEQALDGVFSGVRLWDREVSWPWPEPEAAAGLDGEPAVPAAPSKGVEEAKLKFFGASTVASLESACESDASYASM